MKILRSDLLVVVGVVGFLAVAQFFYRQGEFPAPEGRRASDEVQEVVAEGHVGIERRERDGAVKTPDGKSLIWTSAETEVLIAALLWFSPWMLFFLSVCFWGRERVLVWYFRQKKTVQAFLLICFLLSEPVGCVQAFRVMDAAEGKVDASVEKPAAFFGVESAQFNAGLIDLQEANWLLQGGRKADADQKLLEAFSWFREAAEEGHQESQYRVGRAYRFGLGVARDAEQAASWIRLAADQGLTAAQILLGQMFFEGEGVPLGYAQAYMWSSLASVRAGATLTVLQGDRRATESIPAHVASEQRDRFASKMTPEQIAEGQRLAREWFQKHSK